MFRLALILFLVTGPVLASDRVLAIGGAITEIVYALGEDARLVGRDTTSVFPPEAEALPDVGYMRALSPEGVLSLAPDLIIADEGAGPAEALDVLTSARVPIVMVPNQPDAEGLVSKIMTISDALGVPERGAELAEAVKSDLEKARARVAELSDGDDPKRVLFILSTQGGRILASGTDTAAAAMITLAGGVNANTGFEGYKPLNDEAVTALAPDLILMMDRGGDHDVAVDELLAMPALASTPAAQNRAVVRMDGLFLLGFGPRTAQAVRDLSLALYGN
ncbi:ABC transporter substrate-binding protein [Dinoroseobacter sp. PD6]|nr:MULTISPECIES: ABC transporter substrate-binding protein [Dinoroseobacter]MDD9717526.1 ABC transporter substrate-binding protein [Dinoroseobacter sp. PD6]URF48498.1 ABC transporter substrate-binding protein [Dinoroseobacter shibae]URF52811.1 ABC transporter substrate-binding protein [Dinoroseobacter shibae]